MDRRLVSAPGRILGTCPPEQEDASSMPDGERRCG